MSVSNLLKPTVDNLMKSSINDWLNSPQFDQMIESMFNSPVTIEKTKMILSIACIGVGVLFIANKYIGPLGLGTILILIGARFLYPFVVDSFTNVKKKMNIDIKIYKKDSCPYCLQAMELAIKNARNYSFYDIDNINDNDPLFETVRHLNYVPLIFIDDHFIGSLKELRDYLNGTKS